MHLALSPEQEELQRSLRRFCTEKSPPAEVRRLMDTTEGYDAAVWDHLARQLGLAGLAVPEEHGGQGSGFAELAIAFEEMGRVLFCAPFFSTVALAANAIRHGASAEQQREVLPRVAGGAITATLAATEPQGRWDAEGITMEAAPRPEGDELEGTKTYVVDGHTADLIVVAAREPGTAGPDGISLFLVDGDAVERTPLEVLDPTRKQAELRFDGVRAQRLGEPGTGWTALRRALDEAAVCLSAELVGVAQACLDMAVDYAKQRVQFGRPIGTFQAIKHTCAEMLLDLESARSAVLYAAWAADAAPDELGAAASLAKTYCSDAAYAAARRNIQIHGGIGFTWEHDAHLYYRRAKSSSLLLGDPGYHRDRIAQELGI